jgi:hypothetical protein
VDPRAGLDGCEKSCPTGIRSPECPTHDESMFRLHSADAPATPIHFQISPIQLAANYCVHVLY